MGSELPERLDQSQPHLIRRSIENTSYLGSKADSMLSKALTVVQSDQCVALCVV